MKTRILIFLFILSCGTSQAQNADLDAAVDHAVEIAAKKMGYTILELKNEPSKFPSTTYYDVFKKLWYWHVSTVKEGNTGGWAPGFWPGCLWQMYELTGDPAWKSHAQKWTAPMETRLYNGGSDVGVNMFNTFVPQFRVTADSHDVAVLLDAARQIVGENLNNFNENAGVLGYDRRADLDGRQHWHAFIDHLPNLELLYWAADHADSTEAETWRTIATRHALTIGASMINPLIPGTDPVEYRDGSIQRGFFDYRTGEYLFGEAKQGWTHNSTWSRGQSWIVYGFSAAYAATQNDSILACLKIAADYFIDHLPANLPGNRRVESDYVPQWDFDFTAQRDSLGQLLYPDTERDASAGAMGLAGLLKLVQALPETDADRWRYWNAAENILASLCSPKYLAEGDETPAILLHGCYVHSQSYLGRNSGNSAEDVSLIWGDFYFLYSLNLYKQLAPRFPSAVDDRSTASQLADFILIENFPNPFNSSTTVRFEISSPQKIRIELFDICGRRVRFWPKTAYSSGSHQLRWDGRDAYGNSAASGLYFIKISSDALHANHRLILLR